MLAHLISYLAVFTAGWFCSTALRYDRMQAKKGG